MEKVFTNDQKIQEFIDHIRDYDRQIAALEEAREMAYQRLDDLGWENKKKKKLILG